MLVLPNFSWTFVGEADSYRRRPFPLNFLQYESSNYPTYVHTSKLSKAFDNSKHIETVVDLSQFAAQRKKSGKDDRPFEYTAKESLVTSTKEFINKLKLYVLREYNKTRL